MSERRRIEVPLTAKGASMSVSVTREPSRALLETFRRMGDEWVARMRSAERNEKCGVRDARGRSCHLLLNHHGDHEAEAGDLGGLVRWTAE